MFVVSWCVASTASLDAAAAESAPVLTVRVLGSYPYYETHEYLYWPRRTVACATKGRGRVPADQADPMRCHTLVWDRHRNAVLALVPKLAQIAASHAAEYRFGCAGLDTPEVEIEGAELGVPFRLRGDDPTNCADAESKLVREVLELTP